MIHCFFNFKRGNSTYPDIDIFYSQIVSTFLRFIWQITNVFFLYFF